MWRGILWLFLEHSGRQRSSDRREGQKSEIPSHRGWIHPDWSVNISPSTSSSSSAFDAFGIIHSFPTSESPQRDFKLTFYGTIQVPRIKSSLKSEIQLNCSSFPITTLMSHEDVVDQHMTSYTTWSLECFIDWKNDPCGTPPLTSSITLNPLLTTENHQYALLLNQMIACVHVRQKQ